MKLNKISYDELIKESEEINNWIKETTNTKNSSSRIHKYMKNIQLMKRNKFFGG